MNPQKAQVKVAQLDFLKDQASLKRLVDQLRERDANGNLKFAVSKPAILVDIQTTLIDFGTQALKLINLLDKYKDL